MTLGKLYQLWKLAVNDLLALQFHDSLNTEMIMQQELIAWSDGGKCSLEPMCEWIRDGTQEILPKQDNV